MTIEIKDPVTRKIAAFLNGIGIETIATRLDAETFLPGILVEHGKILFDEAELTYPGDLLHEAGHLALASSDVRSTLNGEVALPGVHMEPVEVHAIAWSYAAILFLELDPTIIFHEGGYGVGWERLLNNYNLGVYIGVGGLIEAGLALSPEKSTQCGSPPYPHMIKWTKE